MIKKLMFISVFFIGFLIAAVAVVYENTRYNDDHIFKISVYSFNPSNFKLEAVEYGLTDGDEYTWLEAAVTLFASNSRIPAFTGVWPDGEGFLTSWSMEGNIFNAVFPAAYHEIPPLEEALFRAAFVWTMTGLPYVNQVRITVEGDDLEFTTALLESRRTVEINPAISSVRLTTQTFTLYYINDTHEYLVPISFTSSTVDMDQIERYIVTQLIEGSEYSDLINVIPPETRILEIVNDEYTCYVNLSGDFINRFNGNTSLARLMIYSIVNSLTDNLTQVKRVGFFIDSEVVDQFHGLTDFHQVFERDETLIMGYEPPAPDEEEE